jgi:DNA end-binding protein Ku
MIEDKKKGHKPAQVAEPDTTNVIDLMSALRASLAGKNKGSAHPADQTKPTSRKREKGAAASRPKARKAS